MVLSPGEAILFFRRCLRNKELLYQKAKDVEFSLGDPFNWARKPAQIEVSMKTVQEGHQATVDAVVEKKTKAWVSGCPGGKTKPTRTSATAYNIKEWM